MSQVDLRIIGHNNPPQRGDTYVHRALVNGAPCIVEAPFLMPTETKIPINEFQRVYRSGDIARYALYQFVNPQSWAAQFAAAAAPVVSQPQAQAMIPENPQTPSSSGGHSGGGFNWDAHRRFMG